jgi:hypothetical protein
MARFQQISDEDLKIRQDSLKNNNTTKNEKKQKAYSRNISFKLERKTTSTNSAKKNSTTT